MKKRESPLNYAFSIGRIKALERYLLTSEVFEETVESGLEEALRLFVESGLYTDEILHIKESAAAEKLLDEELAGLKILVSGLIPDKELLVLLDLNTLKPAEGVIKGYPGEFLKEYLMHLADMHNIKSFLRLYILKEPTERLEEALGACEGFIKKKEFLDLYTKEISVFLNRLSYIHKPGGITDYNYYLGDAVERAVNYNSFISLEKAMNDFLFDILKPAKYIPFGPEPVLAYYFARVNEINLMRMIILAKLSGAPDEVVKERLNKVYA